MPLLDKEERKQIASILSKYDSLFYAVANMSEFHISNATQTAAICLNTETMQPVYLFNPDFWKDKNIYGKAFLVCHEILHFVLGHLFRDHQRQDTVAIKNSFPMLSEKEIHTLINKAMDLSDNHTLLNHYGFEYEKVSYAPDLCWTHTLFPDDVNAELLGDSSLSKNKISKRLNYEKYLHLLLKLESLKKSDEQKKQPPEKGDESNSPQEKGNSNNNSTPDQDKSEEKSDEKSQGGNVLDDHDSDVDKDILNEEGLGHLSPLDELDDEETDKVKKDVNETLKKLDPQSQEKILAVGKESGSNMLTFTVPKGVSNKKWETVCKDMIASIMKMGKKRYDSFNHIPNFMRAMPSTFRLPDYREVDRLTPDKFKLVVFVDCSGSMSDIIVRLVALLNTIPRDKFDVHFCFFDTKVVPVNANEHGIYENVTIPSGYGTAFQPCETYIQTQIAQKKWESYPDLVWMWTDGAGSVVQPEFAKRWTVFLTKSFSETAKRCLIHIKHVVKLKDYV